MTPRAGRAASWAVAVLASAAAVAAAWVSHTAGLEQADGRRADVLVIVTSVVLGAAVLSARPGHDVGRILLWGAASWAVGSLALETAVAELLDGGPPQTAERGLALLADAGLVLRASGWAALLVLLPVRLPDGRPPTGRLLHVQQVGVMGAVLLGIAMLSASDLRYDARLEGVRTPWGLPTELDLLVDGAVFVGFALVLVPLVAGVGIALRGWRAGDPLTRQRVGWLLVPVVLTVLAILLAVFGVSAALVFPVAAATFPVAVAAAVLQDQVHDLAHVVNRGLVWLVLSAGIAGACVVAVTVAVPAARTRSDEWWFPVAVVVVVTLALLPLRRHLQRTVNRLTYGAWDEPEEVLGGLATTLAAASDRERLLATAVTTASTSLRLTHLAVTGPDGQVLASYGVRTGKVRRLPLVVGGRVTGELVVAEGRRRPGDEAVLSRLAAQLAPLVRAATLEAELERSREALVQAREEERRRLRRDLHDGVGPALAGLALKLDALRNTSRDGPDGPTGRALLGLRQDTQNAMSDVRRLVEDLRPPALDDLGLAGALRSWADRAAPGLPLQIRVGSGVEEERLPAAVEVAAYRIAQEALANVMRHADAGACAVTIERCDGMLRVRVADDGRGLRAAAPRHGNGLSTMAERAGELRGTVTVQDRTGGGTEVVAELPLPRAAG